MLPPSSGYDQKLCEEKLYWLKKGGHAKGTISEPIGNDGINGLRMMKMWYVEWRKMWKGRFNKIAACSVLFQDFIIKYRKLVRDIDDVRCSSSDGDENSLAQVSMTGNWLICGLHIITREGLEYYGYTTCSWNTTNNKSRCWTDSSDHLFHFTSLQPISQRSILLVYWLSGSRTQKFRNSNTKVYQ